MLPLVLEAARKVRNFPYNLNHGDDGRWLNCDYMMCTWLHYADSSPSPACSWGFLTSEMRAYLIPTYILSGLLERVMYGSLEPMSMYSTGTVPEVSVFSPSHLNRMQPSILSHRPSG